MFMSVTDHLFLTGQEDWKLWVSLEKFSSPKIKFPGISPKSPQKEAFKLDMEIAT